MSLEDTEINVGGVSFKGVYIAVFLTALGTISGGIWAASEFYSRVGAIESSLEETIDSIPDVAPINERLAVIEEKITDLRIEVGKIIVPDLAPVEARIQAVEQDLTNNDVAGLQGKLAELATSLGAIMKQVDTLVELSENVTSVEKEVTEMRITVDRATRFSGDVEKLQKEVEDLWNGLDAVANPLN